MFLPGLHKYLAVPLRFLVQETPTKTKLDPGRVEPEFSRVRIHQPFSRTLYFSPKFCYFECNATADWLNRMLYPIRSCVTFKCY